MPDWLKDRIKEVLSAIVSGVMPAGTWKWSQILPFVNSQVAADLSVVAGILAVILALVVCVYSRLPRPPSPPSQSSTIVAFAGLGVAILGLLALVFLTGDLITIDPGWESFANRVAYLFLVVAVGAPIGWTASRAF
jgi:hypothetical protein